MNQAVLPPAGKNSLIWINSGRMRGAPCLYQTRLPIDSLFEDLEGGVSRDEYLDAFSLAWEQAAAVLEFTKTRMLKASAKN